MVRVFGPPCIFIGLIVEMTVSSFVGAIGFIAQHICDALFRLKSLSHRC